MFSRKVSPVLQFVLLIVPVVLSGFYLVYSLVGLLLDGQDKFNWSLEAREVALMVGSGISLFSLLVLLYARFCRLPSRHLLNLSAWGHMLLAIVLTIAVFLIAD